MARYSDGLCSFFFPEKYKKNFPVVPVISKTKNRFDRKLLIIKIKSPMYSINNPNHVPIIQQNPNENQYECKRIYYTQQR